MLPKLWRSMTAAEKSPYVTQSDLFQQFEQQGTTILPWEIVHAVQDLPRSQTIRNVEENQLLLLPNATVPRASLATSNAIDLEPREFENLTMTALAEQAKKKASRKAGRANAANDIEMEDAKPMRLEQNA
jgi:hypothetical protein